MTSPESSTWNRHFLLIGTSLMHIVNDGVFMAVYPLIPSIAREFQLSFGEVGVLKTLFSSSSSIFQVPAAIFSEKVGEIGLLALGMGWVSAGLVIMALSVSFVQLMGFTFLAGIGGSTQHPIATSLVSRTYATGSRGSAVGLLNFSGDLGKILAPLIIGFLLLRYDWRTAFTLLGLLALAFSLCFWLVCRTQIPKAPEEQFGIAFRRASGWGIADLRRFSILSTIGILDGTTRSSLLTFIPLLLTVQKGMSDSSASFMLSVLLVGGACGKIGCGVLTDRFGAVKMILVTEFLTASLILTLLLKTDLWIVATFFGLGFMLNGTSTVLYVSVADVLDSERNTRGYGLYYTIYLLSSAVAPFAYGMLGNVFGLQAIFIGISLATFSIIPLAMVSFSK